MAESNFAIFGASAAEVKRGVTAGFTPPNGGGNFVFGFNSQIATAAACGLYYDETDFSPLRNDASDPTGGSVRGALKRGVSTSATGFATSLFMCLQGGSTPSINDTGYLLGLADNDPSEIVLAKVAPVVGLDPTATTALRVSSATYTWDTWLHLRLDVIVNPNGDVVLKCFKNDLDNNLVTSPVWESIAGMDDFVDDGLGINSGSNPLAGGWGGWVFYSKQTSSRGFVDHFEIHRQA
jgi:hypothetical protein